MINWHGPNLRDRLDIKVDHLLHRQSVISRDQRVAQWLKRRDLQIDSCAVILKGPVLSMAAECCFAGKLLC